MMNSTPTHWQEARRLEAWHLKQQGWSPRPIAAALGVSDGAVRQWMTRTREAGPAAWQHRSPPGAPCRVSAEPLARLPSLLCRGPTADGCRGDLWTRRRIAAVIRLEFGVMSHPGHLSRGCQALRWRPQKPARRARWRDDTWPALNKGRQPSSTRSSW
jgi:transposase